MLNASLPLTELHRHLDGNIRPNTIWELSQKNGLAIGAKSPRDVADLVYIKDKTSDLLAFLEKLDTGIGMLATLDDCRRVAYENVEDAFNEGLDYVELRFSPLYMARTHNLPTADVVAAVIDGINQGAKKFPVRCQLIGILSRTFGVQSCAKELAALLSNKDSLCGLDLAGDELNFPAEQFRSLFTQARDVGWNITVHAGEAAGPESIWDAINLLGAQRIGHGVAAIHDNKLMDYLAKHHIGIEACPTSNFQTGTVENTAQHPLKTFLSRGIAVTLSTDDPGVSAIDIQHEYKVAANVIGLNKKALSQIQINGVEQSFTTEEEKRALYALARAR